MNRIRRTHATEVVTIETIIVGFDNTDASRAALRWAAHHAKRVGAELLVVYVASSTAEWELSMIQVNPDPIRHEFEKRLQGEWTESLRTAGVPYRAELVVGRPADALLDVARACDPALIVVGMSGRGTLGELVVGNTASRLSHHAARPIVTVPPSWEPAEYT